MPTFNIHTVNSTFASEDSINAPSLQHARTKALKGALAIGADEICKGIPFFGAEIRIQDGDKILERMVVAIGTSSLQ